MKNAIRFVIVTLGLLLTPACARSEPAGTPQTAPAPASQAQSFPAPDRPVASIITSEGGVESERDAAGEASSTIAFLPLKPGVVVADIGAGSGYFTTRLSRRIGANGTVIATDVTPDYLEKLKGRVASEGLSNVSFVLGGFDDPRLGAQSVDVALMVRMYHEIEQPYAFMWRLREALKPGGIVAIVENDRATEQHGTPKALLRCELEAVGYEQLVVHQLDKGILYLALFAPSRPRPEPRDIKACKS